MSSPDILQGNWEKERPGEGIVTTTETWAMEDGCRLYMRTWITGKEQVLIILHGLGAHGGWFVDMGDELAKRGLNVYIGDHRGFGRSEGERGHIDTYQTFIEDTHSQLLEIRRRHPQASLFLLGHSMGGIFATYVAARYPELLAGVLFLNPWVRDTSQQQIGTMLSIFAGGLFKSKRAWQVSGGAEVMTTNEEAIHLLSVDPYWQRTQTASFLVQLFFMRNAVLKEARKIALPAFVLQAEKDLSVVLEASSQLYQAFASIDKVWRTYASYGHDSEFEADRHQLDDDIVAWIEAHSES